MEGLFFSEWRREGAVREQYMKEVIRSGVMVRRAVFLNGRMRKGLEDTGERYVWKL